MRYCCLIVIAAFFWIATPSVAEVSPGDAKPIKLGYLLDLTGKGAFLGRQSQAGAMLAVREFSGTDAPVEIFYEDHQTDPRSGVTGAQKLLNINQVEAVLCDLTPACVAASPIIARAKKLFLYQAPVTSILATNEFAFKNFLDYEDGCRRVANWWKHNGIERVAHLKVNTEFGELCLTGTKQAIPTQQEFHYNTSDDLRSIMTRLKRDRIQVAFQTGYEADYVNRFRLAAEAQVILPAGMPESLLTEMVRETAGNVALEQTVTFGFPPIRDEFIKRLNDAQLYRGSVSIESAAIAYLHVLLTREAILSCGRHNAECQTRHLSAAKPDETIGFHGWKNRIAQYDYQLKVWQGDKLSRTVDSM